MALLSKDELKQKVLSGDADTAEYIRQNPGTAESLIEDLLVASGCKLETRFQSLVQKHPNRYVFKLSADKYREVTGQEEV